MRTMHERRRTTGYNCFLMIRRILFIVLAVAVIAIVLAPSFPSWAFSLTGEEETLPQIRGLLDLSGQIVRPPLDLRPDAPIMHAEVNPYGINTFLQLEVEPAKREKQVQLIAEAGFHWLRQEFPWYDIEISGKGDFEDCRFPPCHSAWDKYDQIVDLADKYGLADLHQLRGRVGRYKHRAYCYLMLEQGRSVTASGAKRLKAIEEFSELGAGFKIAMRDLEIRGAGNILGTEQSGHISSVGYELYCQLLDNAVRGLTHEPLRENVHVAIDLPVAAYLPDSYIPAGRAKIEMYRKVSQANSPEALLRLQAEMRDRYGPIPSEAAQLVAMRELQLAAWRWKIDDIHLEDRFVVLGYRDVEKIGALRRVHGNRLRIVDRRNAYLLLDGAASAHDRLLDELKSLLQVT